MDRAKDFIHRMSEDILDFMDKHDSKMTPDKVTYLAAMCDDYTSICEAVEFLKMHKDGSLYHPEHMIEAIAGSWGGGGDNPMPRPRRR